MIFENIKNICVESEDSWKDKIFLTFDIDWASDEVLNYILDIIEKTNIKATFFCTHETKTLKRMRKNNKIEIGIHPNFNFLLKGDFRYGENVDEVVEYYMKIIPDAVSVRSHCLTQGSIFVESFIRHGLRYDCNNFIPASSNVTLKPWNYYDDNLTIVPLFWEDDLHCLYKWKFDINYFLTKGGLKVFNFHPVTVLLNIENIERYYGSKHVYHEFEQLKKNKNSNYGVETFLIDLIDKNK